MAAINVHKYSLKRDNREEKGNTSGSSSVDLRLHFKQLTAIIIQIYTGKNCTQKSATTVLKYILSD